MSALIFGRRRNSIQAIGQRRTFLSDGPAATRLGDVREIGGLFLHNAAQLPDDAYGE